MSIKKVKLGELCTIEKGKIGITKAIPGEYPLVVTAEERLSHNEYHFEGNAVVIPLVSSSGHGHRSLKRIHFQQGRFAVGSILCVVMPKDENILSAAYLYRFLDLNKEQELVGRMRGMANVSLPMGEIAEIEIPLPPVNEQEKFVKRYSKLEKHSFEIGSELTHQLSLVKQLRQAFLREAMQGKLVPQHPKDGHAKDLLAQIKAEKAKLGKKEKPLPPITPAEIPFEIPEGWVWCRLGEVCWDIVDCPHSTPKYLNTDTGFYAIDTTCIEDNGSVSRLRFLSENTYQERIKRLEPGENDIIYAREGSIGLATLISGSKRICLGQRVMLFRASFGVLPKFLKLFVTEGTYIGRLLEKHRGMGAKHVNVKDIVSSLVALPPMNEQMRIIEKVEEIFHKCDELEITLILRKSQTEQLLQQVLREALNN